ncbi:4Fe-4S binding protein [Desulfovibrio sp.]|uniref:4Fe-4S binding protein n=1 Tax=Desulfovibrio sp. TaxID=885 RepID=UPI0023D5EEF1|nr:4Fe-4S binding protein [Desulfovibrio sp.]MDE7241402.1 4Fe-4S binding protein [Desulfovibrio sp.]
MAVTKAATRVFSPCGGTENVTEPLTGGLPVEVERHDLTRADLAFYPFTDADTCISCGQCAENCPGAIPEDDLVTQDDKLCIRCSACAHVCPVDARTMGDARARALLHEAATVTFAGLHLETKLFL